MSTTGYYKIMIIFIIPGGCMNKCLKIVMMIMLCGLSLSVVAANEFVVLYRLSTEQEAQLATKLNIRARFAAQEEMRIIALRYSLQDKLSNLLKAADFVDDLHIIRSRITSEGACAVVFDKDLDEEQAERFIKAVKQDREVENIWENASTFAN